MSADVFFGIPYAEACLAYIHPQNKKKREKPSSLHHSTQKNDIWGIICDPTLVASGTHFMISHEPKLQKHHQ